MDRLRQTLLQIQTQLGVLTRSQRIAIALCSALVVVSLLWLMRWSTDPELVPLLTERVADIEELAVIREQLRGRTYKVAGNQVFVKPGERQEIILDLSSAGAAGSPRRGHRSGSRGRILASPPASPGRTHRRAGNRSPGRTRRTRSLRSRSPGGRSTAIRCRRGPRLRGIY